MSTIINVIQSFSDLLFATSVAETEVLGAEERLGLRFSPEYTEYVMEFGAAMGHGHELTGVLNSERLNVVSATIREREINVQIPKNLYVIENPGINGIIIWQDAEGKVYETSPHSAPKVIAGSLAEYLKS